MIGAQQVGAQPLDGVAPGRRLDLGGVSVAARVVGGGVVAEAIAQALDEARALSLPCPLDGRSTRSRTATTSLPSTCSPGIPAAMAFCARVSAAVWARRETEIAHWLLFTTKTTGRRQTPATLMAS